MAILDFVDCKKHGNKVGKVICHGCYEQLQAENERLKRELEQDVPTEIVLMNQRIRELKELLNMADAIIQEFETETEYKPLLLKHYKKVLEE